MPGSHKDSKRLFGDRAEAYARFRPRYPARLLPLLRERIGFSPEDAVADIGSGTGILTRRFLENGNEVFGVEPNAEMRRAAEASLAGFDRFHSVAGTAEATGLSALSADFITAAQSFHWFDVEATRREFRRILRPGGRVAVIWIHRPVDRPAAGAAYEEFLLREIGEEYRKIRRLWTDAPKRLDDFFKGGPAGHESLEEPEEIKLQELTGRMQSYSFVPPPGSEGFGRLAGKLAEFFTAHGSSGEEGKKITLLYSTDVYWGEP